MANILHKVNTRLSPEGSAGPSYLGARAEQTAGLARFGGMSRLPFVLRREMQYNARRGSGVSWSPTIPAIGFLDALARGQRGAASPRQYVE